MVMLLLAGKVRRRSRALLTTARIDWNGGNVYGRSSTSYHTNHPHDGKDLPKLVEWDVKTYRVLAGQLTVSPEPRSETHPWETEAHP